MAIISGIFTDPFGTPLSNVTLRLLARTNTSATFTGTNAAAVTAADGSYSMSVLVGLYAVSAIINRQEDYLGVIQVYPDSPDGTLNEYLACFNPDDVTPAILAEMELLVAEAKAAAAAAEYYAEIAKEYALIPRGSYDPSVSYAENDLVEFDGSEYRAMAEVSGTAPPASPWQLFVSKGDTGAQGIPGDTGPNGPANMLAIGTVTTVAPDQPAAATITGDTPDQTLNLSIPQGKTGDTGQKGPPGEQGEKGDTGEQGPPGEGGIQSIDTFPVDENNHVQLTQKTAEFINPTTVTTLTPELTYLVETAYIHLDAQDFIVDLTGMLSANSDETLDPGYTLRLVIGTNSQDRQVTFSTGTGYLRWVDGAQRQSPALLVPSSSLYMLEVKAVNGAGPFVTQLCPPPGEAVVTPAIPAFGEPGAGGFFRVDKSGFNSLNPAGTISGSNLRYAGINTGSTAVIADMSGSAPSGTWEARGYLTVTGDSSITASYFTRIDTVSASHMRSSNGSSIVRNPRYVVADGSLIDCELFFRNAWHPFTASPVDVTWWGREIYERAQAGEYGDVAAYVAPE